MADRDERSRLSAFASPEPLSRLGAFSDAGRRQSTNIEDVTGAGHLDRVLAYLQSSPVALSAILKDYTTPWRYRDMPDTLREISDLLTKQQIPPMRGFAEGGNVEGILAAYSAPVRSWPGEQALDDEARANYQAMHPEAPQKLRPDEAYRGTFLPFRDTTEGKHEWAVPGFLMDVADTAKAIHGSSGTSLGPMIRPSQYSPEAFEQILGHGMAGALAGIAGNMPRVALGPKLARGEFELGSSGSKFGDKGPQMSMSDDVRKMYHGTGGQFDKFDLDADPIHGNIGLPGVWFTFDRPSAEGFAKRAAKKVQGEPRVIEAEATGRPLEFDVKADLESSARKGHVPAPVTYDDYVKVAGDYYEYLTNILGRAKDDGYDYVILKNHIDDDRFSDQAFVFDPDRTLRKPSASSVEDILNLYTKD